jgi:hypothetical protein
MFNTLTQVATLPYAILKFGLFILYFWGLPMPSICIVTPTYVGDAAQFSLLRRSINAFAPTFPQIAIVNTEDFPEFRDRFGGEPNLEIIKSAEVLPRAIEYRRRRSGPKWLTALRRVPGRLIKGWHAQQLMKLFLLSECSYDAVAFFDSDVLICRPIGPDYFYIGDRLKLYRRRARDAECMDFDIAAHEILGNPLEQITELYDYIYSPACFRKSTAVRLFAEFHRRRRSWVRRFLMQRRASEYHLLGYAATVLEGAARYQIVECNPDDVHHSVRYEKDRAELATVLQQIRAQHKDFALLQSRLNLDVGQIAAAFEELKAASSGVSPPPPAAR